MVLIISVSCLSPLVMDVIIIFKLGDNNREQDWWDEENLKNLGGFSFSLFFKVIFHIVLQKKTGIICVMILS